MFAAACAGGHHDGTPVGLTDNGGAQAAGQAGPTSGGSAACQGQALTSTDIGVTADTITVEIMADTGATNAPGMANGSVEAVKAWAKLVNSEGGLACRQIKVQSFDSKIDPSESAAGYAKGCQSALGMVGTYALAVDDVSTLQNCKDKNGAATGLPETAAAALNPLQACGKTTFLYAGNTSPCPPGRGEQTFDESSVYADFLKHILGVSTGHGMYYVVVSPPSVRDTVVPEFLYMDQQGMKADQMTGVASATSTQANFTPFIAKLKADKSQFYFSTAVFSTLLQAKAEAAAQGVSDKLVWLCGATCYDKEFQKAGGAAAVGTYVAINTLPLDESSSNAEVKTFTQNVKTQNAFSLGSWLSARLFQKAIEDLVQDKGPNALTRANVLQALGQVKNFDAGGMIGPITPSAHEALNCIAVVRTETDGFKRVWPAKPGTLQCGTTGTIKVDPQTAYKG